MTSLSFLKSRVGVQGAARSHPPEIAVTGVSKVFGRAEKEVHALSKIDLRIPSGEFVAIVGPSGCGKSTLLNILAGLDNPSSGTASIGGIKVEGPTTQAGMVFQRDLLLEWRSCADNVALQFEMRGEAVDRGAVSELLAMVGIEKFANHYPRQLSGGMRQRVAICRALVHKPGLLFMDEPFGALDAITREHLNDELARLSSGLSKTVVFVTHDIEEAVYLADRVIVMTPRPGRIVMDQEINIERPRGPHSRESPAFADYTRIVRRALETEGGSLE